ncbi:MAG: ATP synthase F1 subunit epsilon [Candidatus Binatia bacterium]
MADTLQLRLVTPQREVLDETVAMVTAEGTLGQFGVLPQHIAFVTSLEPGILTAKTTSGAEEKLAVKGGFAEVRDDVVTILADDVVAKGEIDATTARAKLEAAERALAEAPYGHTEHEARIVEKRWAEILVAFVSSN